MDHPSHTLRLVLETTEKLAAEIGCQNTTLQEIIKRSGISKGAIYHYVQSKDELFGLILEQHMLKKVNEYQGNAPAPGHPSGMPVPPHGMQAMPPHSSEQHPGLSAHDAGAVQPQPNSHAAAAGRHPHGSAGMGRVPHGMRLTPSRLGPVSGIVRGLLQPADESQVVLRRCFVYLLSRQEQPDVARILANLHQSWIEFTSKWIEACQQMGLIAPSIRPAKTSALIISILFGLMVQKSITEHRTVSEEFALETDLVLEAIAGILGITNDAK
jgi:AcrR family transcriptional regulator